MEVYHISRSLQPGDWLTPDYEKLSQLAEPFLQGLERGSDCFTAMVLQGKYLYAVMSRSGLRYWADYAKYATEAVFEFVRRREFPQSYSRLGCAYFFDSEACCRNHFEMDYGEDPEEGAKVGLFQVELEDPAPQYRDMCMTLLMRPCLRGRMWRRDSARRGGTSRAGRRKRPCGRFSATSRHGP